MNVRPGVQPVQEKRSLAPRPARPTWEVAVGVVVDHRRCRYRQRGRVARIFTYMPMKGGGFACRAACVTPRRLPARHRARLQVPESMFWSTCAQRFRCALSVGAGSVCGPRKATGCGDGVLLNREEGWCRRRGDCSPRASRNVCRCHAFSPPRANVPRQQPNVALQQAWRVRRQPRRSVGSEMVGVWCRVNDDCSMPRRRVPSAVVAESQRQWCSVCGA